MWLQSVYFSSWLFSALAANKIQRFAKSRWLKDSGKGATPSDIGLLCVTLFSLGQNALILAGAAILVSAKTKLHPILILIGGAVCGIVIGKLNS
ncbi:MULTISPECIES: chromate transporter [Paenibacillus]|uniref:chromate transporter n=1 Tax=Paenibacillus TaxID=44249 RepID=UPI000FD67CE6|nr:MULTISPECIES: chromate transporter [Paenibacillus]MCY9660565.1 hypothetical protein [Paenibacillus anseongense]